MNMLYYIGIILFAGLLAGKLVSYLRLPSVTGYLLAGVLIGPSVLNIIPTSIAHNFNTIADTALGFIAFSIGSEFQLEAIKKVGFKIVIITIFEALGAVILVFCSMYYLLNAPLGFSIVISSIAAATAPAATLMVIKQYKAKGPLVDTLLPIVALDDAVSIIIFGISLTIAKTLSANTGELSLLRTVFSPLLEISFAVIIGFSMALLLIFVSRYAKGKDHLLSMSLAVIFLSVGLASSFNLSPLLTCMMLGATTTNLAANREKLFSTIDKFSPPVFLAFFTIAGIELNLGMLKHVGLLGLAYIIARVIGKSLGAALGSRIAKCPDCVQKYLGFTLVPQAGVAIGLAMVAESTLPEYGASIRTIILSATVVYELIGPLLTKTALIRAGEIKPSCNLRTVKPKTI